MLKVLRAVFWLSLGLWFFGIHYPYQEFVLGVCCLVFFIVEIIN